MQVAPVIGKGLGLVARVDVEAGELVAYYLSKLYKTKSHVGGSTYCLASGVQGHILDRFDRSFPPPEDGVPYVAPLVNEPTFPGGVENCKLRPAPLPDEDGTIFRHGLYTMRDVKRGEELTWDYGPGYGERSYPSKYRNK